MDFMLIIPIAFLLGLIPANIAKNKGKSFGLWWVYGTLLFIVAFIHSLLLKEDDNKNTVKINGQKEMQQYSTNIPIVVTNYSFSKKENNLYLAVTFGNMSSENISSVKMDVYGFNSFNDEVIVDGSNHFQLLLQDMKLEGKATGTFKISTPLPNLDIRKVKIIPQNVLMEDGTIYNAEIVDFNIEKSFTSDENAIVPKQNDNYWLCSCGYINPVENNKCQYCASNKDDVFSTINNNCQNDDKNEIVQSYNKTPDKKRNKAIIISSVVVILILGIIAIRQNYKNNNIDRFFKEIDYVTELNINELSEYSNEKSNMDNLIKKWLGEEYTYKVNGNMVFINIEKMTEDKYDNFIDQIISYYKISSSDIKNNTVKKDNFDTSSLAEKTIVKNTYLFIEKYKIKLSSKCYGDGDTFYVFQKE